MTFTTPATFADSACSQSANLIDYVEEARLYVMPVGSRERTLIGSTRNLAPGRRDTIWFMDPNVAAVMQVETMRKGKWSCASNPLPWNLSASVPPGPAELERELFDLAGRRVAWPAPPGVYFERVSTGRRRLVVLR